MNIAILVGLLGDFLFSFLSARGYLHYLIIILPSLMIVVGTFQSSLAERSVTYRRLISLTLVVCILFGGVFAFQKVLNRFFNDPGDLARVSSFLNTNTVDSDRIQVLGSDTRILVYADRRSASSITYSHPATSVFYRHNQQSISKLESEIKSELPKYIVRNIKGSCAFQQPSCGVGSPQYSEENLAPLYGWILRHYQKVQTIGDYEIWHLRKA
jgi:hypothetical protein